VALTADTLAARMPSISNNNNNQMSKEMEREIIMTDSRLGMQATRTNNKNNGPNQQERIVSWRIATQSSASQWENSQQRWAKDRWAMAPTRSLCDSVDELLKMSAVDREMGQARAASKLVIDVNLPVPREVKVPHHQVHE
jgi:hypothetical protein